MDRCPAPLPCHTGVHTAHASALSSPNLLDMASYLQTATVPPAPGPLGSCLPLTLAFLLQEQLTGPHEAVRSTGWLKSCSVWSLALGLSGEGSQLQKKKSVVRCKNVQRLPTIERTVANAEKRVMGELFMSLRCRPVRKNLMRVSR